jgi:hypothetical protein
LVAGVADAFSRVVALPNGPVMDAAMFERFDMQYVVPPIVG